MVTILVTTNIASGVTNQFPQDNHPATAPLPDIHHMKATCPWGRSRIIGFCEKSLSMHPRASAVGPNYGSSSLGRDITNGIWEQGVF